MRASIVLIAVVALFAGVGPPDAHAQTMPVFGPKQYTRTAGPPQTFTEHFSHCGTQACQLVIVNGNANGAGRVSSASVSLNGVQIVGPSDFNQNVGRIVIPVGLTDDDTLAITLASGVAGSLTVTVECATSPVDLSAGAPGDSLFDSATLLTALPIVNDGTATAQNVTAKAIVLTGGTLSSPNLPVSLGSIPPDGSVVVNSTFSGAFAAVTAHSLTVSGTYAVGAATYCFALTADFTIPPAAPGSAPLHQVSVPSNRVIGGGFPPGPPDMDDDVNGSGWTVPLAPFVAGVPTATPTVVNAIPDVSPSTPSLTLAPATPLGAPLPIVVAINRGIAPFASAGETNCGDPLAVCAEPSGATTAEGVIWATANWSAAWSTDGGSTFHPVDPHTVFPLTTIDFCCDQIVQYVPSIDRFVWLLQGNLLPGYHLAVASPADIATYGGLAWTYWNLTTGLFNHSGWFDYPDLAFGDTYLYLSWNAGPQFCKNKDCGHQVARIPLAQLQAGGTIVIGYTDPNDAPMAWGAHLTQNSSDAAYWAGHKDSTHLRVFSMKDSEDTYSWHDVPVASSQTFSYSSVTPDGLDWMGKLTSFPAGAVVGATRNFNGLWFAWSAAADGTFSQPHIEMVTLNAFSYELMQQVQIWSDNYAFAYPALSTNACTGEVGLSLEFGGNGHYENHAVGIWGDYAIYGTTRSNLGTDRYGDYVTIRPAPPTAANPGNLFAAFGFGYGATIPGITRPATEVRYILFGRPASFCLIP
ncbi:MAG: hypothetical protein E6H53_13455 [Betaproteobacteria bacterium]|nr:MAG: hypothetical protein E6H53_13455 [Betaproteobacteria bacterium]